MEENNQLLNVLQNCVSTSGEYDSSSSGAGCGTYGSMRIAYDGKYPDKIFTGPSSGGRDAKGDGVSQPAMIRDFTAEPENRDKNRIDHFLTRITAYFLSKGLTVNQACAIAGNSYVESGAFVDSQSFARDRDNRPSWGLFMYCGNGRGESFTFYANWCDKNNKDWRLTQPQMDYAWASLKGEKGTLSHSSLYKWFMSTDGKNADRATCAIKWREKFEVAESSNDPRRKEQTEKAFKLYQQYKIEGTERRELCEGGNSGDGTNYSLSGTAPLLIGDSWAEGFTSLFKRKYSGGISVAIGGSGASQAQYGGKKDGRGGYNKFTPADLQLRYSLNNGKYKPKFILCHTGLNVANFGSSGFVQWYKNIIEEAKGMKIYICGCPYVRKEVSKESSDKLNDRIKKACEFYSNATPIILSNYDSFLSYVNSSDGFHMGNYGPYFEEITKYIK